MSLSLTYFCLIKPKATHIFIKNLGFENLILKSSNFLMIKGFYKTM